MGLCPIADFLRSFHGLDAFVPFPAANLPRMVMCAWILLVFRGHTSLKGSRGNAVEEHLIFNISISPHRPKYMDVKDKLRTGPRRQP